MQRERDPKRTVLFLLFSSEESGLDGSKHFVEHPPVPLERIVAYFNLDCVGHGDSIQVGSGKTSPKLWQLARDLDALLPLVRPETLDRLIHERESKLNPRAKKLLVDALTAVGVARIRAA